MTVIFQTNAGTPVLAGDMLISVHGSYGHTDLRLPSQPNGIVLPTNGTPDYIPIRMRRKIFVVNPRMAVGVAGSVAEIRMFMNALVSAFFDRSQFTRHEIRDFLHRYGLTKSGMSVLSKIGVVLLVEAIDWGGTLTCGAASPQSFVSDRFGRGTSIGTGADTIVSQIEQLDKKYKYGFSQPGDGDAEFPDFATLANNFMLLANVYWKEFTSPDNLFDAWGGAYDLIFQGTDKDFRFLNEYSIFLRLYNMDEPDKGIQLVNVLKYERRSNVSLMSMLNNGQLEFFGAKDITAAEGELVVSVGGPNFTMNSNIHVSIIGVGKGTKYLAPMIQIDGLDPNKKAKQTVFTEIREDGRLWVAFEATYDDWLTEQARAYFAKNADKWP